MPTVSFIGGGQMATALIAGLVRSKFCAPAQIAVSDPSAAALAAVSTLAPGCRTHRGDNAAAAAGCDILVVAVKPNLVVSVLSQLSASLFSRSSSSSPLVISVAAGVTLATMQAALPAGARLVRVMPNTPALVGAGASGFALGAHATAQDEATAAAVLASVGRAWRVEERLLDAVCGLSGSGPAYMFTVIEAMADGGVLAGLPRYLTVLLALVGFSLIVILPLATSCIISFFRTYLFAATWLNNSRRRLRLARPSSFSSRQTSTLPHCATA